MTPASPLLVGVELGGTKCVCVLGTGPADIRAQVRIVTREPMATLAEIRAVLDGWRDAHGPCAALGIASFGPLDLRPGSSAYGHVTSSAKPGWRDIDVVGGLGAGRGVPVGFDTDVNGAALAEGRWGAAYGLRDFAYITVGTGVGVGLVVGGQLVRGCNHTELGHVRVARMPGDQWPGICPYHGDCVEGLASGPAIAARAGRQASEVPAENPAWEPVVDALGQLLHTLVFATAPARILVGGGVAEGHPELHARLSRRLSESVNGFVDLEDITGGLDRYVVRPGLGALAGPLGALALAADALAVHTRAARGAATESR
jgi:fructokinase